MKLVCLSFSAVSLVAVSLVITAAEPGSRTDPLPTVGSHESLVDPSEPGPLRWIDLLPPTEPHPDAIVISPGPERCFVDGTEMPYPKAMTYLRDHQHEIVAVHFVQWKAETKGDQLVFDWLNETGIEYSMEHHTGNVVIPSGEDLPSEFVGD